MTRPADIGARLRAWAEKDGRGYPDWLMRYGPVVRRLRPALRGGVVLEIGANEAGIARFSGVAGIVVDCAKPHLSAARSSQPVTPVAADIARLPFATGSIEVLVCLETMEHLPDAARAAAIAEIVRCLSPTGRAAISFPSGAASAAAEARIQSEYHALTGGSLRWLAEHDACGLPDATAVQSLIADALPSSHRMRKTRNANLRLWIWMWRVLMCGWPGRGNSVFQAVLRVAAPLLARCHVGACYRVIFYIEPVAR